ncbi:hypothetical protein RhiirA1_482672 [Rhizophagus irregularis]|uniref:Uncharacterized protein n=1 Tax=Rhizophagus irregularis TaxID=588596 RepID=A0A2N0QLJ0_9GLOM|nr:hypothetical protein RhiirA1_482672 [Rhizophagus irregularis]
MKELYMNELQVEKEKRCNISSKMKKMKSNSKKREDNNIHVVNFNGETNWNKWNDLAFHWSGHWANF